MINLFLASWSISSQVTHSFCPNWLQIQFSWSSWIWSFARTVHRTPKSTYFTSLLCFKGFYKGYNQMKRYIRSWVKELLCRGVGMYHPATTWMCSPTQKLFELSAFDIFLEGCSHRHDWSFTQFPAPLHLREDRCGAESPKLLIMSWSFWWPAGTQEPSCLLPRRKIRYLRKQFLKSFGVGC